LGTLLVIRIGVGWSLDYFRDGRIGLVAVSRLVDRAPFVEWFVG